MELTNESFYTLCQFIRKDLSTYDIAKILESSNYKADYRNVHPRIKRFLELRLIEEIDIKTRNLHAAKYYRLSTAGIFCIFYHLHRKSSLIFQSSERHDIISNMVYRYGNDEFFNLFVYPFFHKETISEIKSEVILEFFFNYCTEIAHKALSKLFEVTVIDEKNIVKGKNKRRKLSLEELRKKQAETWLSSVKTIQDYNIDSFFEYILNEIQIHMVPILTTNIVLPIISEGKYWSQEVEKYKQDKYKESKFRPFDVRRWNYIEKDIVRLCNDDKFYDILKRTKKDFDNCFANIVRLRQ